MIVFAHFGHWYISGPVYLVPVLALVVYLKLSAWRENRHKKPDRKGRPGRRRD